MRANSSAGPLARGVSIFLFSHGGRSARIKMALLLMHSETFEQLLERAASECGIDPGFWDIWGRYHHTSREAKQAILRAMGIAADNAATLSASLAERTRREWER